MYYVPKHCLWTDCTVAQIQTKKILREFISVFIFEVSHLFPQRCEDKCKETNMLKAKQKSLCVCLLTARVLQRKAQRHHSFLESFLQPLLENYIEALVPKLKISLLSNFVDYK